MSEKVAQIIRKIRRSVIWSEHQTIRTSGYRRGL